MFRSTRAARFAAAGGGHQRLAGGPRIPGRLPRPTLLVVRSVRCIGGWAAVTGLRGARLRARVRGLLRVLSARRGLARVFGRDGIVVLVGHVGSPTLSGGSGAPQSGSSGTD